MQWVYKIASVLTQNNFFERSILIIESLLVFMMYAGYVRNLNSLMLSVNFHVNPKIYWYRENNQRTKLYLIVQKI